MFWLFLFNINGTGRWSWIFVLFGRYHCLDRWYCAWESNAYVCSKMKPFFMKNEVEKWLFLRQKIFWTFFKIWRQNKEKILSITFHYYLIIDQVKYPFYYLIFMMKSHYFKIFSGHFHNHQNLTFVFPFPLKNFKISQNIQRNFNQSTKSDTMFLFLRKYPQQK